MDLVARLQPLLHTTTIVTIVVALDGTVRVTFSDGRATASIVRTVRKRTCSTGMTRGSALSASAVYISRRISGTRPTAVGIGSVPWSPLPERTEASLPARDAQ